MKSWLLLVRKLAKILVTIMMLCGVGREGGSSGQRPGEWNGLVIKTSPFVVSDNGLRYVK